MSFSRLDQLCSLGSFIAGHFSLSTLVNPKGTVMGGAPSLLLQLYLVCNEKSDTCHIQTLS